MARGILITVVVLVKTYIMSELFSPMVFHHNVNPDLEPYYLLFLSETPA